MILSLNKLTLNLVRVDRGEYEREYYLCDDAGLSELEERINRHNDECDYYGNSRYREEIQYLYQPRRFGSNIKFMEFGYLPPGVTEEMQDKIINSFVKLDETPRGLRVKDLVFDDYDEIDPELLNKFNAHECINKYVIDDNIQKDHSQSSC